MRPQLENLAALAYWFALRLGWHFVRVALVQRFRFVFQFQFFQDFIESGKVQVAFDGIQFVLQEVGVLL